ncbi:MAG: acetamidase/formamidase family protein [Chloroflexi bacterium]|nr:acetamidase/formamidase family protein [Chloroflexota bacterium]
MKGIEIDRSKRLKEEPGKGHNRWHPDIPPALEVEPGEEVLLETRDALDGQILPGVTTAELEGMDTKVVHPLTGPVYVKGADPGDLLEIEYLKITSEPHGFTLFRPGSGLLGDLFTEPYLAHWEIENGWARSPQLPGVRIPDGSFMGTAGLAPSHQQIEEWTRREAALKERGGVVSLADPEDAVPAVEPVASRGLRTVPPRENCGNADVKQLTRGSRLFVPVGVPGALYSVGDGHFAQGDSECCLTAIEVGSTVLVRFQLHQGMAARQDIRFPRFAHEDYFNAPQWAVPKRFTATMGMPIREDGTNEGGNLTLAARNALLAMLDLLQERGWTAEQAYVLCSVAVDLKISNIVNLPNVTVSAFLPEDIFQ